MLHTPVFNPTSIPVDGAVIYRPRANQIAVVCVKRGLGIDVLKSLMPVGEDITSAEQASMKEVKEETQRSLVR
jgi:hypothetical protein